MTIDTQFVVYGQPVSKARPRLARNGRAYTPAKSKEYEMLVRVTAVHTLGPDYVPTCAPVAMSVRFYMARPKRLKQGGAVPCDKTPDIDNLLKSVLDGLNGVAFADDKQVCEITASKWYCAYGESPRAEVEIRTLA